MRSGSTVEAKKHTNDTPGMMLKVLGTRTRSKLVAQVNSLSKMVAPSFF